LVKVPAPVGTAGTDGPPDPAARWRTKRERRDAWEAWEQSGAGLDAIPAGLVSASLDACQPRDGRRERWR
jgi:hypothetical protein